LGASLVPFGRFDEGIQSMQFGMRSSPKDFRLTFWSMILAYALGRAGRFEEALAEASSAARRDGRLYTARVVAAWALTKLGRETEAHGALAEARRIRPTLSLDEIQRFFGKRTAQGLEPLWNYADHQSDLANKFRRLPARHRSARIAARQPACCRRTADLRRLDLSCRESRARGQQGRPFRFGVGRPNCFGIDLDQPNKCRAKGNRRHRREAEPHPHFRKERLSLRRAAQTQLPGLAAKSLGGLSLGRGLPS